MSWQPSTAVPEWAPKTAQPEIPSRYDQFLSQERQNVETRPVSAALGQLSHAANVIPFSDEIISGATALLKGGKPKQMGQNYEDMQMRQQALRQASKEIYPDKSLISGIAGGLALATAPVKGGLMPAIAVSTPPKLLGSQALGSAVKNIASGAATGGTYGALYGAGEGDASKDTLGSFGERVKNTLGYGTIGTLVGGAIPAVIEGGRALYQTGKNLLGGGNSEQKALAHILRSMERSGTTPEQIASEVGEASARGVPAAPLDRMGDSGVRLGRTIQTIPGRGSEALTEFVDERQAGQGERLANVLRKNLGNADDFAQTADDLLAARREQASPHYQRAFEKPSAIWNDELAQLFKRPSIREAVPKAYKIAAELGEDPNSLVRLGDEAFSEIGFLGKSGKRPVEGKAPNLKTLHYIREGLDDIIEGYRDKTTGKLILDKYGRGVQETRGALDKILKDSSKDLAKGDAIWSGFSNAREALQMGRQFGRGDIEKMEKVFTGLNEGEKELFRVGAARELKKILTTSGDESDKVKAIFGTPDRRARLKELLGDQFDDFANILGMEKKISKNNRMVTGGSPTGRIAAEQDAALGDNIAADLIQSRGNLGQMMWRGLGNVASRARGIDENSAAHIASYLRETDPSKLGLFNQKLSELQKQQLANFLRQQPGLTASKVMPPLLGTVHGLRENQHGK